MSMLTHPAAAFSALTPAIQAHLVVAVAALLLGPVALRARKGQPLHRWAGRVWALLMLGAAISSLFIRDTRLPNIAGYTPIHLLTLLTFASVGTGLWAVWTGRISLHQRCMRGAYIGGCLIAGAFTLMPGRYLGSLLWHHTLGWV